MGNLITRISPQKMEQHVEEQEEKPINGICQKPLGNVDKLATQRKFIWRMGWDFYALFRYRLLTKHLSLEFRQFASLFGFLNVGNSKPNETNLSAETAANKESEISPNLPFHRRLPMELNCQIFQFLKLAIQLKFIWRMGRGIYGMFGPKIRALKKTKRLYNPRGNGFDQLKSDQFVTLFPDELNVLGRNCWLYVIAKKGFAISGQHCRMDHFPGTILYYYEIIRTSASAADHWGFRIGLSAGSISKYFGSDANNSYCIQRASFCYREGQMLQMAMGDSVGCGLLLGPKNNASIFYTTNGTLMGKPRAIPSVDLLFPTLSIYSTSFEANFGDNPEKPFKFDILNCPELELEFE